MNFLVNRKQFSIVGFILTCSIAIGVLIGAGVQTDYSIQSLGRQNDKLGGSDAGHIYKMETAWFACGGIPYIGWEGCTSQSGKALKCDDGERVYLVEEHCTSPGGATDWRLSRLQGTAEGVMNWQTVETTPLGDALVVELADLIQVTPEEPASSKWVCLWTENSSLVLIYGPDREHVEDYFRIRQKDQVSR